MTVFLDVTERKEIKSVGICGNDKPFSWENEIKNESCKIDLLHKKTFERNTKRICTESKFTVKNKCDLTHNENQKKYFSDQKTAVNTAKFDVVK